MSAPVANHYQLTDEAFLSAFVQSEIAENLFNHEAHIRVCWLLLQKYPLLKVLQEMTGGLKKLVTKLGAADKYHETLTVALTLLVHERRDQEATFYEFMTKNQDLLTNWRGILGTYYSEELLGSEDAKQSFRTGDL